MKDSDDILSMIPRVADCFKHIDKLIQTNRETTDRQHLIALEIEKLPKEILKFCCEDHSDAKLIVTQLAPLFQHMLGAASYGRLSSLGCFYDLDAALTLVKNRQPAPDIPVQPQLSKGTKYTLTLNVYESETADSKTAIDKVYNLLGDSLNCYHKLEVVSQEEIWFNPEEV